jgi:hypothetical protein
MWLFWLSLSILLLWITLELVVRGIAEKGITTDFYGSIRREDAQSFQRKHGLKYVAGQGWFHVGWVANPEKEIYDVQVRPFKKDWCLAAQVKTGSALIPYCQFDAVRVIAENKLTHQRHLVGIVEDIACESMNSPERSSEVPMQVGDWHPFFKPQKAGDYINDHCLYQDLSGKWRIMGITAKGIGNYDAEKAFAVGLSPFFPPQDSFVEDEPVADFGQIAWAPDVIKVGKVYHLFWSPNQLHHMVSEDGVEWHQHQVVIQKPYHKFFRDAMIYQIAPDQWLLYATARGVWFSRIDIYQSFDLQHWQYIRPALRAGLFSKKNFVTGSMESPFVFKRNGSYYLSTTYNNESFFLSAICLQIKKFLNRKDYNNTLLFHSTNPYDFGVYRGRHRTDRLLTRLEAHAPVYVVRDGEWFITTCGWPFAATLTSGEAAWCRLEWQKESKAIN